MALLLRRAFVDEDEQVRRHGLATGLISRTRALRASLFWESACAARLVFAMGSLCLGTDRTVAQWTMASLDQHR